ncbi:Gp15 family bacteriophage protein [bacterium]|nr:Gp15 family bacteriophage protein [bacterium]
MEADFQREYNLDLWAIIDVISWRRFFVLLQGLSADSLLFSRNQRRSHVVTSKDELQRRWKELFL